MKRDNRRLRPVAIGVAAGMLILLAGLVVCANCLRQTVSRPISIRQSFRTVRHSGHSRENPGSQRKRAGRGQAALQRDSLPGGFAGPIRRPISAPVQELHQRAPRTRCTNSGKIQSALGGAAASCNWRPIARWSATSLVASAPPCRNRDCSTPMRFLRHYTDHPYVPFQIVPNLAPRQVAIFAEQLSGQPALELETQPVRVYPTRLAGGAISWATCSGADDRGRGHFLHHARLRGQSAAWNGSMTRNCAARPGVKSVLVNNLNYRQREDIETPNQPGNDVYLTIDLDLQRAAEKALADAGLERARRGRGHGPAQRRHPGHGLRPRRSIRTNLCPAISDAPAEAERLERPEIHAATQPRRHRRLSAGFDFQNHHRHRLPGDRPGPGGSFRQSRRIPRQSHVAAHRGHGGRGQV